MTASVYHSVWLDFIIRSTRVNKQLKVGYERRPVIEMPLTVSRYSVKTMKPLSMNAVLSRAIFNWN